MTISFVSIFTFGWILENKSREPLKTRQYVTAETLTIFQGVGRWKFRNTLIVRQSRNENPPTTKHNCWQRPRHQYGQNSGIQVRSYRDSYFILYGWSSYRVKRLALRTHFCSSSLTYSLASWKEISPERHEASFSSASFL